MRSRVKRKNLIVALLVGIVCFLAGLFFYEKKEPTVNAKADTGTYVEGFYMHEGLALRTVPNEPYVRFTVSITQEMKENLFAATTVSNGLFGQKIYKPTDYYLKITRKAEGQEDYEIYYHIDPDHSDLASTDIQVKNDKLIVYLVFPINTNYEIEYTYHCEYGKMGDIPYHTTHGWFTREGYISLASSTTTVTRSVGYVARAVLENEAEYMSQQELEWMNHLAGYTTSTDTFTVNLNYQTIAEYGRIATKTEQYQVNSLYVGSGDMVYSALSDLKGFNGISYFNAVYKNPDGTPEEIILQANSYTYVYDQSANVGTLTITYRPFEYKSFAVRLQDNDAADAANLYYYIHATKVSENTAANTITLEFNFSEIVNKSFNDLGWIFELTKDNFTVTNNSQQTISTYIDNNVLKVTFSPENQDDLKNLSVFALSEIIEDYYCDVNIAFSSLSFDGATIQEAEESKNAKMMYSEYVKLCNFTTFKDSENYKDVEAALSVAELNGQEYFIPSGVEGNKNTDGSFTLQVLYDYNTLFKITDERSNVHFVACTKNSLTYNISDLNIAASAGYRIQTFGSSDASVDVEFDEANTSKLSVTLKGNAKEKKIIPLYVGYSDVWNLNVVYMDTYKSTPFAEQKEYQTTISVSDYDIKNLTLSDIKKILGRTDDMKICGITKPFDDVDVELTSESTYTITLNYGVCSLRKIDYEGTISEIRIPLTSYVDWCNAFGDDLTIMMLNTSEKTYFEDETDVARENLYGFFSVAIFEEQVSDFNYLFRNSTGDGNVVKFEVREAVGSSVYKFFDGIRTKGPIASLYGHVGMAYCEILNDDNKILHSYFFYMDATEGYMSNGGADNKDDTDTAFGNKAEDIGDWFKDVGNSIKDVFGVIGRIWGIMLGVSVIGLVVVGVVMAVQTVRARPKTSSDSKAVKKNKAKNNRKTNKKTNKKGKKE